MEAPEGQCLGQVRADMKIHLHRIWSRISHCVSLWVGSSGHWLGAIFINNLCVGKRKCEWNHIQVMVALGEERWDV